MAGRDQEHPDVTATQGGRRQADRRVRLGAEVEVLGLLESVDVRQLRKAMLDGLDPTFYDPKIAVVAADTLTLNTGVATMTASGRPCYAMVP